MDEQKRRWKRFKVDIRVKIRHWETPDSPAAVCRTYELSEGGLSVFASEPLEIGTLLLAEFLLPSTEYALQTRVIVRNRRGFRCGMEFVALSASDKVEILRYLGALEGVIDI